MSDKMREAFEEWATGNGHSIGKYVNAFHQGEYLSEYTAFAWMAWQAAQTAAVPELPDPTTDSIALFERVVGPYGYAGSFERNAIDLYADSRTHNCHNGWQHAMQYMREQQSVPVVREYCCCGECTSFLEATPFEQVPEVVRLRKVEADSKSVAVVGEPVAWGGQTDDGNVFIPAAELATLREKAAQLEQELETERMRLAACGVIALANTEDSALKARDMLPEYWSASAQDCASTVDREMDYRSRLAVAERERDELRKDAERYRWLRDDAFEHSNDCFMAAGQLFAEHHGATFDAAVDAAIAQGKGE